MLSIKQPPFVNGIMDLSDIQKNDIIAKLNVIKSGFVASDDFLICDTFFLVSNYNRQNVRNEINGDTCEFLLRG